MALVPSRIATAAVLAASTLIIAINEVVMASDTGVVKVGDGVRTWNTLPTADNESLSADRAAGIADETGTGVQVYGISPTLTTPTITGGTATSLNLVTPIFTATNNITASATQTQVGATALTTNLNRVVTVVSANDAVRLPVSYAGRVIRVKNAHATNAIGIFPPTGDAINALAANAVYALAAGKSVEFFCMVIGFWDTLLSA